MKYDVIVIGGGPSGLMASIAASQKGAKVLLVEKGNRLGRKLAISGGGRCNVTNAGDIDEIIKHIPGNGRFLYSCLSTFSNKDIIRFFEGLGIKLKEEDRGRMFPVSDKASDVVQALVNQIQKQGVEIRVNALVKRVLYQPHGVEGVELKNGETIDARAVIIATGGKSVPHTGSTGDGYAWAEAAGHTITELYPTEVPITSQEPFISNKTLQGLSLRDVTLTVWNEKGKKEITHEGEMIFTHFGLSGPAALRCSQFVVKLLKKSNTDHVLITLDLFPKSRVNDVAEKIRNMAQSHPKKTIKNVLKGYLPERLIPLILEKAEVVEQVTYAHLTKKGVQSLADMIKRFPIRVNGTLPLEKAFVTGGGIHLKEVDPKTMQSKLMPGLFFCGEILDIHGYTGGYNITAAFTTGYNAGLNAALTSNQDPNKYPKKRTYVS